MSGMIPLLLIVGAMVVMGMLRKKNLPTSHPEEYKPEPSPWDELLKELNQAQQQDEETAVAMPISNEEPSFVQAPIYEFERPYSYEDDVVDELSDAQEAVTLATPVAGVSPIKMVNGLSARANLTALPGLTDLPELPVTSTKSRSVGLFAQGFDPRMAVVYAEVLKPKYLEY